MSTAASPFLMPVARDLSAPSFTGQSRTLLPFLNKFERLTHAAKITEYQQVKMLPSYVCADVARLIHQYDEFDIDATAAAGAWEALKKRLLEDFPDAQEVVRFDRTDYESFVQARMAQTITTKDDVYDFTRNIRMYSAKLVKSGQLTQTGVNIDYYHVLRSSLGKELTFRLLVQRYREDGGTSTLAASAVREFKQITEAAIATIRARTSVFGPIFDS